jgi:hypothetical protein
MSKGRFINQKLGKRTDRKSQLLKAQLKIQRPARSKQPIKPPDPKGHSR